MKDPLGTLLSFPHHSAMSEEQYDKGMRDLVKAVRPAYKNLPTLAPRGELAIDAIDPSLNSLAYLAVLFQNVTNSKDEKTVPQELWSRIVRFLEVFDSKQVRYAGLEFRTVVEQLVAWAYHLQQPELAIVPVSNAILRLDPSGSTLTSSHIQLVQLALASQAPSMALDVLDLPILHFPDTSTSSLQIPFCSEELSPSTLLSPQFELSTALRYQDALKYFIYTGSVYIMLRDWEKALESLDCAVSYPVKDGATSKIQVEAYKKWILVHLLLHGTEAKLSAVSPGTNKTLHAIAKPYETIAKVFATGTAKRLKQEADIGRDIWKGDENTGLILAVLNAHQKFHIKNLAKIYHTIPVSKLMKLTASAETGNNLPSDQATEALLTNLISNKELYATLSHPPNSPAILTFSASGPTLSESDVQRQLDDTTHRLKTLAEHVKATDRRLTRDKDYLRAINKQKKAAKTGAGDGGDDFYEDLQGGDADEDLMTLY